MTATVPDTVEGARRIGSDFRLERGASSTVEAGLRDLDGRPVAWFRLAGGPHAGAIGPAEGEVLARLVDQAGSTGVPVVGRMATSGADVTEGFASLHAWGRLAQSLARVSGVVPILFAVDGPCVSGPALLLGLADHVVMTPDSFAYVSGPGAVVAMTGVEIDHLALGGATSHATRTGVASLVVDRNDVDAALGELLSYLPGNHLDDPPLAPPFDVIDRDTDRAAAAVPSNSKAGYDVRTVIADVVDDSAFLEIRAEHAPNIVTGYARLGGRAIGVVANQPAARAGTIDIAASSKAARFVQSCDAFNMPLVTFVDTPGFEPGRDLEWRGMTRHGAELVHAYAAATVPRLGVIVRKAYGGAYIVMDSRTMGNDACFAWVGAEIAVMGAPGAVAILHGKQLASIADPIERERARVELERDYAETACSTSIAAERGLVDDVIDPRDTRRALGAALAALTTKRDRADGRKHANTPM